MKISDLSIRRPVFASMVSTALVLFGVIGYSRLSVREYPDVDPPIVSVSTELTGANPQVVESAVTDILEEELSTVQGLRTLTSSSQEGFSNITLEFTLDRDVEAAAQDVRERWRGCGGGYRKTYASRSLPRKRLMRTRSSGSLCLVRTTTCSSCRTSVIGWSSSGFRRCPA